VYAEEERKMSLKIVFQAESVKDQKRSVLRGQREVCDSLWRGKILYRDIV